MFLLYSQFALFAATALLMTLWLGELHLRNRRSWEAITAKLQTSMNEHSPRAMFRRAGWMMEACDYVEWRTQGADREKLEVLRGDAVALRLRSATAMIGMQRRG